MTVYEIITDRIIQALEKGEIPWKKPWNVRPPMNYVSKKAYRGINIILLAMQSRTTPYWVSYKQAQALGGNIREGEKATPVVFWKWNKIETEVIEEDETKKEVKKAPILRYYNVFNLDQTEGIEIPKEGIDFKPIEKCEQIVAGYPKGPVMKVGGDRACYDPKADEITAPIKESFNSPESYYATLFHEMTHSTGHTARLNREGVNDPIRFGSEPYAKEELVAEIGASFLSAEAGVNPVTEENTVAYIQNWLKALKNDKKLVIYASAQAQKAVDHILNRQIEAK
jgi:antirestriction protein ArdC